MDRVTRSNKRYLPKIFLRIGAKYQNKNVINPDQSGTVLDRVQDDLELFR